MFFQFSAVSKAMLLLSVPSQYGISYFHPNHTLGMVGTFFFVFAGRNFPELNPQCSWKFQILQIEVAPPGWVFPNKKPKHLPRVTTDQTILTKKHWLIG